MINFKGRLIADDSMYSKLRYTKADEVIKKARPFVEADNFIVNEDVLIKASPYAKGDKITIQYGNDVTAEVACSYGGVDALDVLCEILKIACVKNNIKFKTARPVEVFRSVRNYCSNKSN